MLRSGINYHFMQMVLLAFITGLTTGGLSCLAVQGGFLASAIAQQKNLGVKKVLFFFLASKLVAYILLGAVLGLLGSAFLPSPYFLGSLQILAGVFMILTALQLLQIHPIFNHFIIKPPKWAYKLANRKAEDKSAFAPALLGFLTILIPCGTTQAMMALSISSGSPFYGAAILGAFVIGTIPTFAILGATTCLVIKNKTLSFLAASVIFALGILSLNTGQILRGSPHTLQNYYRAISYQTPSALAANFPKINNEGKQEVTIQVRSNGYASSSQTLKVGVPVKLTLNTSNVQSCARSFVIPSQNLSKILPATGTETIEFTPTKEGQLAYTCSMGMYTGQFTVVN